MNLSYQTNSVDAVLSILWHISNRLIETIWKSCAICLSISRTQFDWHAFEVGFGKSFRAHLASSWVAALAQHRIKPWLQSICVNNPVRTLYIDDHKYTCTHIPYLFKTGYWIHLIRFSWNFYNPFAIDTITLQTLDHKRSIFWTIKTMNVYPFVWPAKIM